MLLKTADTFSIFYKTILSDIQISSTYLSCAEKIVYLSLLKKKVIAFYKITVYLKHPVVLMVPFRGHVSGFSNLEMITSFFCFHSIEVLQLRFKPGVRIIFRTS